MHKSKSPTPLASASGKPFLVRAAAVLAAAALMSGAASTCAAQTAGSFTEAGILSDGYAPAAKTDPKFIDPWGVSGGKTPTAATTPVSISFTATIPPAAGSGTGQPTGTVQNTVTGFILSNGAKASFLFSTLDGTISGWNSATSAGGNNALIAVNNSAKNAVYTDMAILTNAGGTYLLVPNFGAGADVEVYNTSFQPATLAGTFTDPNIPAGYAPYAVKVLGTQVFVTYMLRTTPPFATGAPTYQEILGTNTGFVSVFDVNGNFVARAVTGGNLNAPWGVAIAPAAFGIYGGDLLIGNFGDGLITAYNPTTYAYQGVVADGTGKPIAYPGLWDIFTNTNGDPTAIYFTAGLAKETHGLLGVISNNTAPTTTPTFNFSASTQVANVAAGSSATVTLSVAPTNSFAGTVALSCSGLPKGAACFFSPSQLAVTPNAPSTATVIIATNTTMGELRRPATNRRMEIWSAFLLPLGSLFLFRRGRRMGSPRMLGVVVFALACAAAMSGCSTYVGPTQTPAGTSNVTITATAGTITQSAVVALTVH
jgi:uncharacterized protein (TIGR03118 family)